MNIETKITTVTVYLDRALVARKGKIQLTGEETKLIIPNLPLTINSNSIRVGGRGTTSVKILAVRTETVFSTQSFNDEIAKLEQERENLEKQRQTYQDRIEAISLKNQFVQTLSTRTAERFSLALAKQETNLAHTEELINFLGDRYLGFAESLANLKAETKELEKNISIIDQKLAKIKNFPSDRSNQIVIPIEPSSAGEFELEVAYTVDNARWTPLYDLEFNSENKSLELSYLAEVRQNSGEDWQGVKLILSTAQPSLGSLPPKLQPWYLDVYNSTPIPASSRSRAMVSDSEEEFDLEEEIEFSYELSDVDLQEAELTNANVNHSGGVISFEINGYSNVPSDNNPHKVTIFRDRSPLEWNYLAIPKLVDFPYLQATVTNPAEGVTLLPGTANIFRDHIFVGKTNLGHIVPGETFKLDLGVEEKIKLERDLVERQVNKKLFGDRRRVVYAYRLKITNLLADNILLNLTEQLPVSKSEKIKVIIERINPKIEPQDLGILEWTVSLASQEEAEIYYQFAVEYLSNLTINGLDI
jgi:uncharacterized protein (TIGR02231 family)